MTGTYLSPQQERILDLLDEDYTWASAADELGISQSAFETQMKRIKEKGEKAAVTVDRLIDRMPDESPYDDECPNCGGEIEEYRRMESNIQRRCTGDHCFVHIISRHND